jgi:hypothetical protein
MRMNGEQAKNYRSKTPFMTHGFLYHVLNRLLAKTYQ